MNTNELLVLAQVVADRAKRNEGLVLGAFLLGDLPDLDIDLLTGERRAVAMEWARAERYDDLWSSPRLRTVAYRAVKFARSSGGDVAQALHLLALREESDSVLARLFELEGACSRLDWASRDLQRAARADRQSRSDAAERAASPPEAGDAGAGTSTSPKTGSEEARSAPHSRARAAGPATGTSRPCHDLPYG